MLRQEPGAADRAHPDAPRLVRAQRERGRARRVRGALRHPPPQRLRPDRGVHVGHAGAAARPGLLPGRRRAAARPHRARRCRASGRGRRDPRRRRARPDDHGRLLERPRGDRGRDPRRLAAHGRPGRLDERGFLHFVERKALTIKRAGENIAAGEVEQVLLEHPGRGRGRRRRRARRDPRRGRQGRRRARPRRDDDRRASSRRTAPSASRRSRCRPSGRCATSCRATRSGRSSTAACATRRPRRWRLSCE